MLRHTFEIEGRRYVLLPEAELRRIEGRAPGRKKGSKPPALPPLPEADADGNVPALAFTRASVARDIFRERRALGLTQVELAQLSGISQETLSRIETGRHSPMLATMERIDRAFKKVAHDKARTAGKASTKKGR